MRIVIGVDTSNYTTSLAAAAEDGSMIADVRRLLSVRAGERGLRQSDALFQHTQNLPVLAKELVREIRSYEQERAVKCDISAVAVSDRPRPAEGSYMPVFLAGVSAATTAAELLGVPLHLFSHQEGHIAAICGRVEPEKEFLSFHLSGGTGELVRVKGCMPEKIVGKILDISFGQVLDRVGVAAGFSFPAGAALDRIACENKGRIGVHFSCRGHLLTEPARLKPVPVTADACANLSGIETQSLQLLREGVLPEELIPELFYRLSEALVQMVSAAAASEALNEIIFAGGVSASAFLREELSRRLKQREIEVHFGAPHLSTDNACGIAILGMMQSIR